MDGWVEDWVELGMAALFFASIAKTLLLAKLTVKTHSEFIRIGFLFGRMLSGLDSRVFCEGERIINRKSANCLEICNCH